MSWHIGSTLECWEQIGNDGYGGWPVPFCRSLPQRGWCTVFNWRIHIPPHTSNLLADKGLRCERGLSWHLHLNTSCCWQIRGDFGKFVYWIGGWTHIPRAVPGELCVQEVDGWWWWYLSWPWKSAALGANDISVLCCYNCVSQCLHTVYIFGMDG